MNYIANHTNLKRSLLALLAMIFLFGILIAFHPFRRDVRVAAQTILAHVSSEPSTAFPNIGMKGLSLAQRKIIATSKQQYALRPVSYDKTVLMYTQGNKEAWCADYVSWVYKQAGIPFSSPDSVSWRIPGVYTLQAYFQSQHAYKTVGSYQPKPGDIAIYSHGQGHAAIVLSRHGNIITTIGGNESGRLRIDTRSETGKDRYDLVGFGVLNVE